MLYLNSKTIRLALFLLPTILTACANRTELLFDSLPSGATITDIGTGTQFGTAPITKKFNLDSMGSVNQQGCHTLDGVEAQWASGARKQMPELQLCGKHSKGYTITLVRPPAHPDLEKDIAMANDLQAGFDQAKSRSAKLTNDIWTLENKRAMENYGASREQSASLEQTRNQIPQ